MEEKSPVVKDYLSKLSLSSQYLLSLINDVLDMSRIENGRLLLHPDCYLYRDFQKYIKSSILPLCEQKNITMIEQDYGQHFPIFIDATRFNQVIFNLLSSTIQFSPDNSMIYMIYHNQVVGNSLSMYFEIQNSGMEISKEFQKHIFEPFSQERPNNSNASQATGLGLTIAKAIVDRMDGTLTVESREGKGTSFLLHLTMPLVDDRLRKNRPMV